MHGQISSTWTHVEVVLWNALEVHLESLEFLWRLRMQVQFRNLHRSWKQAALTIIRLPCLKFSSLETWDILGSRFSSHSSHNYERYWDKFCHEVWLAAVLLNALHFQNPGWFAKSLYNFMQIQNQTMLVMILGYFSLMSQIFPRPNLF